MNSKFNQKISRVIERMSSAFLNHNFVICSSDIIKNQVHVTIKSPHTSSRSALERSINSRNCQVRFDRRYTSTILLCNFYRLILTLHYPQMYVWLLSILCTTFIERKHKDRVYLHVSCPKLVMGLSWKHRVPSPVIIFDKNLANLNADSLL